MKYLYNITVIQDATKYGKNMTMERRLSLYHKRDDLTDIGIVRILKREGEWPADARISHKQVVRFG
jgi:hypothetical protein